MQESYTIVTDKSEKLKPRLDNTLKNEALKRAQRKYYENHKETRLD